MYNGYPYGYPNYPPSYQNHVPSGFMPYHTTGPAPWHQPVVPMPVGHPSYMQYHPAYAQYGQPPYLPNMAVATTDQFSRGGHQGPRLEEEENTLEYDHVTPAGERTHWVARNRRVYANHQGDKDEASRKVQNLRDENPEHLVGAEAANPEQTKIQEVPTTRKQTPIEQKVKKAKTTSHRSTEKRKIPDPVRPHKTTDCRAKRNNLVRKEEKQQIKAKRGGVVNKNNQRNYGALTEPPRERTANQRRRRRRRRDSGDHCCLEILGRGIAPYVKGLSKTAVVLVFLCITFSRFVAGIVKLHSECPAEYRVALYMLVKASDAFLFWIVLLVLGLRDQVAETLHGWCYSAYLLIESLFAFVWSIIGTVWSIGKYSDMKDVCPNYVSDWNASFINFSYFLSVLDWICMVGFLIYCLIYYCYRHS